MPTKRHKKCPFPRFLFLGPKTIPAAPEPIHRRGSVCVCVCVCVCVRVRCVCVCARASRTTGAHTHGAGSSATDVRHAGVTCVAGVCVCRWCQRCEGKTSVSTPLAHPHNPVGGQQQQSPGTGGIRHTGENERAARAWGLTGPPRAPTARRSTQTTKRNLGKIDFLGPYNNDKPTGWFDWDFTKGSLIKEVLFSTSLRPCPLNWRSSYYRGRSFPNRRWGALALLLLRSTALQ